MFSKLYGFVWENCWTAIRIVCKQALLSYPILACLSRVYFSRYPPNGELARRLQCARIIQRLFPLLPKGLLAHVSAFDWLEISRVELRHRRKSQNKKGRKLQTTKFRLLLFLGGTAMTPPPLLYRT